MLLYIQSQDRQSIIYTNEGTLINPHSLHHYLNYLCLQYGSSLEGRIAFFRHWFSSTQKIPIVVSMESGIILIPCTSIYQKDCILLNFSLIKEIHQVNNHQTKIIFYNQRSILIDVNRRIIMKQMKRVQRFLEDFQNVHFNQDLCAIIA